MVDLGAAPPAPGSYPTRFTEHKLGGRQRARLCSRGAAGGEPDVIPWSPPMAGAALTVQPEEGNVFSTPRAGAAGAGLTATPLGGQRGLRPSLGNAASRPRLSVPKCFHKWESGSGRCKGTKSRHFRDPSTQKRSFWEFVSREHSSLNSGSCGCKVLAQQPRRSSSDHDARPGAMTARGCSPRPPRTVIGSQVLY